MARRSPLRADGRGEARELAQQKQSHRIMGVETQVARGSDGSEASPSGGSACLTRGFYVTPQSACTSSREAGLLMKELRKHMQEQRQQQAAAATRAAAGEALMSVRDKLSKKTVRPSTLKLVRHPLNEVTLVPAGASTATKLKSSATAKTPDEFAGSNSTSSKKVELVDVSIQDKNLEEQILCACPDLRTLLRRGLTLLEFTEGLEQQEQQQVAQQQSQKHLEDHTTYLLVRRGLPKFFDFDWEALACFFLQAISQQQQVTQQQKHKQQQQLQTQQQQTQQQQHTQQQQQKQQQHTKQRQKQQKHNQQQQQRQQQKQGQQQKQRECMEQPNIQMPQEVKEVEQQQEPQGRQKASQQVQKPGQQQQQRGYGGKQVQRQAQGAVPCSALDVANKMSDNTLIWAHQLSLSLLLSFGTPSVSDDATSSSSCSSGSCSKSTTAGSVEVWALEKLNGEAAQISFCSQLKAWACCSKNVCLLLPAAAAAASSSKYTMPGTDAARAAASHMGADLLQQRGETELHLHEQPSSEQQLQQQAKERQAVELLRRLGADRVVSQPFLFEEHRRHPREHYALRVAAAWQQQLQQLAHSKDLRLTYGFGGGCAQVEELQQLLQSHTLVGELIDSEEKQHIVPPPKRQQHQHRKQKQQQQQQQLGRQQEERQQSKEQQQQQQKQQQAHAGRLAFFALVPHKLQSEGVGLCEPPCLSPGVSLPLLQSFGLETATVVAQLQAASPSELLLQLRQLERQREESCAGDTEGLVLYFCRCSSSRGNSSSSNNSSDSSFCQEGCTVVALAKAKTASYRMRRKLRERLKCLIRSCCFWEATAAAAVAATAACPAGRPTDKEGGGSHNVSCAVLEAFAAPAGVEDAEKASGSGVKGQLTAGTAAERVAAAKLAAAEAALRAQVAAIVGMYWCSALEGELSRFGSMLWSCVHQGSSSLLISEVLRLQNRQAAKQVLPKQLQRLDFDSLVTEESAHFRRAAAFACSLSAALLLALRCLPDPQNVSLLWQKQQSSHKLQLQKEQQEQLGTCNFGGVQLQKDISFLQDLIHGPVRQEKLMFSGCLFRFLLGYVDLRFLDFMADSRAFAAVAGAPKSWVAPSRELLTQLQRVNSSSRGIHGSLPFDLVRMADLQYAGAAVLEQLQGNDDKCSKGRTRKQGKHLRQQHQQHVQINELRRTLQPLTICIVAPPLLLTADQYQELQQVCLGRGCRLLLRHRACATACCCCCLHDSRSFCDVSAKAAASAVAADNCFSASLVVALGVDPHGSRMALKRLHQLLEQQQVENQHSGEQRSWDGIALVSQNGVIEGLRPCVPKKGVSSGSSTKANRFLAADAAVGKAILQAGSTAIAEGILALASKSCNAEKLQAACGTATETQHATQDLQAPLQAAINILGGRPPCIRLSSSLLTTERGEPEYGNWQRALEQVAAAVQGVKHTASYDSHSPAQNRPKAPLGPSHAAASSSGHQRAEAGFVDDRCKVMGTFTDAAWLSLEPSPAASVVALLPVGLPGSGKTTVVLEALRPALRQEFISRNTFSVGGVTGLVLWEGRPPLSAGRMDKVPTTEAAAAGTASATVTKTTASVAAATTTAAAGVAAAVAATPAPLESVFDCVCLLSSDEFTGEALRSLGYNAPTGSLYELCFEEATRAGPAARARLNSPYRQGDIGSLSSLHLDEKTMKAAIAEGRGRLRTSLNDFFTHLTETIVNRFLNEQQNQQEMKDKGSSAAAGSWRPLRVFVVVDRNHPPNAVSGRFYEVESLLHALQSTVLMRCGARVKVATAALLLPPDVAQGGYPVLLRQPGGCSKPRSITWNYPWSVKVVLRCMYRVLCRGNHATLAGGRQCRSTPLAGLADSSSDSDVAQDVKALHICLSFLSCFKGYCNIYDFLRIHPSVTHVLQLQTVLPIQQQQQQEHYQQENQQLQDQEQLLLRALSTLKPFSEPPKNECVYMALAASLRQYPPEGPVSGESQANQLASVRRCASELLQRVDSLFTAMEEPMQERGQLLQHQLQQPQHQQQQGYRQERHHHDMVPLCGRIQQPQGYVDRVAPKKGHMTSYKADTPPVFNLTLKLPTYFRVFLGAEKEALSSLTEQLMAAARSSGATSFPSVADICRNLKPVDSPHVTTFFLGGGTLKANRGEIEAANEWLDKQFSSASIHDLSCKDPTSQSNSSYSSFSPRILLLHELLASRRQINLYFKFQTTHLLLTDIGLACAALTPLSPVLPLAEPPPPQTSSGKTSIGGSTFLTEPLSGEPVGCLATSLEIDAGVGKCGPSCAVCGPHEVNRAPSGSHPLCMAANHYAHVTLGLSGDATAVMSNDAIAAADMAILQGIREKKLRADTPRPFRTSGPRNKVGVPEDVAKCRAANDAYQNLNCYSVGDSDDPQELIVFTGVPIKGRRSRLWVWSLPPEAQEELEGPLQAC
ncbi:uncharacterized protein EMH_0059130 [Eimeria mitis]|uniref:Uncharacterized protein n=1 Tax=Eimeria mitis TaxID=44415 RepID=U6K7V6_9EIME|nr:uncharacterized protein EMH_0059130 [Eimeria mitis]CDJ34090.1 hypothetical protein, conserved [Eimeria mitis]